MDRDLAHEADMRALYREQLEADCDGDEEAGRYYHDDESQEVAHKWYYVKPNERQIW
jgi:hypothetical protein